MSQSGRQENSNCYDWQEEDHQQIMRLIDKLLDSLQREPENSIARELIIFLTDYSYNHAKREEDYMLAHHCAKYDEHKRCHEDFIKRWSDIVEQYDQQGPSSEVVRRLESFLREELLAHIMTVDQEMLAASSK
jgi:hemerythrin